MARGVTITERDVSRLDLIARWYTLSPDHLARMELGWIQWLTMLSNDNRPRGQYIPGPLDLGDQGRRAATHLSNIRKRMSLMSTIRAASPHHARADNEPPTDNEGLVTVRHVPSANRSGYWLTRTGREWAQAPYSVSTRVDPRNTEHTWMAADIGHQLETVFGLEVVSEREMRSGQTFRDGNVDEVDPDIFKSKYQSSAGGERTKRPDLAIIHRRGGIITGYTAIEIERRRSRPMGVYTEKLLAYADDPMVRAVWYICDNPGGHNRVRDRVRRAQSILLEQRKVDGRTTPLLCDTAMTWGRPWDRLGWQGLPGILPDGTIGMNQDGAPSKVGQRMTAAIHEALEAGD